MGKNGEIRSILKNRTECPLSSYSNEEGQIIEKDCGSMKPKKREQTGFFSTLNNHKGIILVVIASFSYASSNVLYRLVRNEIHSIEAVCIIFAIQGSAAVPPVAYKGISPVAKSRKMLVLMCSRGLMGFIGYNLICRSLQDISTGDATVILRSAPVFVGIFARIFLKEAFDFIDIMLTVIVIAGVVLIAQPHFLFGRHLEDDTLSRFVGSAYALGACVCYALSYVINRQLGLLRVDSFVNVIHYMVIGAAGSAILNTAVGVWSIPPCGTVRFSLVGIGLTGCIGQCLITYSYSLEKGIIVSLLQTNEVIFAYLLEFLLFGVTPDLIGLIGVATVLSASVTASLKKSEWVSSCRKKDNSNEEQVDKVTVLNENGATKETM